MTINNYPHKLDLDAQAALKRVETPPMPEGLTTRIVAKAIALPQKTRNPTHLFSVSLNQLGFNLRHDLRYQMAMGLVSIMVSFGVYQSLKPTPQANSFAQLDINQATLAEIDPLLAGDL